MNISKKWPVIGGLLAVFAVIFSGIGTKYLPERSGFFGSKNGGETSIDNVEPNEYTKGINMAGGVPYLRKLPILDNNLFIEQSYNKLIFGGVNFELVKFSARTDSGVKAKVLEVSSSALVLPVFDMPYLEFEYKDKFYTLEINGEIISSSDINLTYEIKSISAPTMLLKASADYSGT
jgi:hypothetical protein